MEKQHLYAVLLESKKLFYLQKQQVEQFNRQFPAKQNMIL